MRARGYVWSIKAGCVAAAWAGGDMLPLTTTMTAQQAAAPPAPASPPAQAPAPAGGPPPNPNAAATAADHKNMMEQLGITALRPGPSGNESAPNHANYDEALANPYPNLPEVLTLKNGRKVDERRAWWKQRRPEIVEEFDREVLGRVPEECAEGDVDASPAPRRSRSADAPVDRQGARRARRQRVVSRRSPSRSR